MNNQDKEKPVVIQIHPLLLEEFKFLKEAIEEKTGYKIYGGMPVVSKLIAEQMREKRLKNKKIVEVTFSKVKGEKKVRLLI